VRDAGRARSYQAIAEWAADAPSRLRARPGLPGPVPDLATIWRVLTAVGPAALDAAVGAWVSAQLAAHRQRLSASGAACRLHRCMPIRLTCRCDYGDEPSAR